MSAYDYSQQYRIAQAEIDRMIKALATLDSTIENLELEQTAASAAWLAAVRSGPGNGVTEQAAVAASSGKLQETTTERARLASSITAATEALAKAQANGHGITL